MSPLGATGTEGATGPTLLDGPAAFVVETDLVKAAWDSGFRLDRGREGPWHAFDSTTARGRVWLAGSGEGGPWWLASDHAGVAQELGAAAAVSAPGIVAWVFPSRAGLYAALDRAYKLGACLPDVPLREFERRSAGLPRTTELERLVVQRVGQDVFRGALIDYWDGRCAVTGISDSALLKASHIVRWADCANDAERLDVHNGLLLSGLWDAAFDAHLVTFNSGGCAVYSPGLSYEARDLLGDGARLGRIPTPEQRVYLDRHANYGSAS